MLSLDVQKFLRNEYWTNRYILNVGSFSAATGPAEQIVAAERSITIPDVQFTSYRLSDMIKGNDQYVVVPLGTFGQRVIQSQALPLFDVLRVDFAVALGRPSRKYLRGVLGEGDTSNYGELAQSSVSEFDGSYCTTMLSIPEYVDVDGQVIFEARVWGSVGMRQLRRGSKRKLKPVIPVV